MFSFQSAHHLLDPSFIKLIRGKISSNRTHDDSYYSIRPSSDHVGTTHVSVLDEDGLAVSATSTINQLWAGRVLEQKICASLSYYRELHYEMIFISLCCFSLRRFGGGVYSPKTGIILNNELSDFCKRADTVRAGEVTDRNIALQAKPIEFKTLLNVDTGSVSSLMLGLIVVIGEQPPSSMTPVILESKSGRILVVGGSGGSLITAAVASVTQLSSVCVQYSCV